MASTDLRAIERDSDRFRLRLAAAALFVLVFFGLLVARLVWLQVVRYEDLSDQAESNRLSVQPVVPSRGLIVDRHGVVLANNYSAYSLEITPEQVQGDVDALIDRLAEVVEVTPRDRRNFKRQRADSPSFEGIPLRKSLSDEEMARFMAQRYRFPGVDVKARLLRNYPLGAVGAHALGYVARVSKRDRDAMADWPEEEQSNYRGTDVIGKRGVESEYERQLHGRTGFEQFETAAGGRAVRRLGGQPATPGQTLVLSLDIKLQALVEQLYGKRRGALVALDPRNGEVLAMVSMPTFDINLFVDGIDVDSWKELNESADKPLLNRAIRGLYPPGSTYKPFMSMAALHGGFRRPGDAIADPGYFMFGNHRFRDDKVGGHGRVDMYRSIVQSCDTYYYVLASEMGVDRMAELLQPFGFGQPTGIDLPGESRGVLPSTDWKRKAYRKPEQQRWYAGETISLGIGQGYNSYTMTQLANATAMIAARGQRFAPRVGRAMVGSLDGAVEPIRADTIEPLPHSPAHFDVVRRALEGVMVEGTATQAFMGTPYRAAGKTGTAQVIAIGKNEKYDASRLAEIHRDHALFMAYAPAEQPRIALAMIVENAGFGAAAAAPIARRVFDYMLLGQWPSEQDMALVQLGKAAAPVGEPRKAADIVLPGAEVAPTALPGLAALEHRQRAREASAPPHARAPAAPAATDGLQSGRVARLPTHRETLQ